ncbi:NAD(P)-dependent dehydrogenase (short-subunit alcohol dehydrogenase family) [Caballeronia udeis]|uniref:NAD(P)-dependent dehydrogenase (Short-subunit alcohol dehydrogenase family) n=1 Tax=Caballeronia udeis TaxID=1232866 RepID=A0ABW8MTY1_9BURK
MQIKGATALVSGANRGLGRAFAQALLQAGAAKVYAGARDPSRVTDPGVIPVALDITDPNAVIATARECSDVTLLINNAGVMWMSPFIAAPSMEAARDEMMTNYFGTLYMCRAFSPVLGANGGGALVNMLSVVSWFTHPMNGSYCASKAAERALTDGLRLELAEQGTLVVGVYASFIETDMAAVLDVPKTSADAIARSAIEGVANKQYEVFADARSAEIKAALARDADAFYAGLARKS